MRIERFGKWDIMTSILVLYICHVWIDRGVLERIVIIILIEKEILLLFLLECHSSIGFEKRMRRGMKSIDL